METSVLEDETSLRALVATMRSAGKEVVIGMGRFGESDSDGNARFTVMTAEGWQRKGIGSQLLRRLIATAALAGVQRLESEMSTRNRPMVRLAQQLGFEFAESSKSVDLVKVSKPSRRENVPAGSAGQSTEAATRPGIRRAKGFLSDAGRRVQAKWKAIRSTLHALISSNLSLLILCFLLALPVMLFPTASMAQSADERAVTTAEPLPVASEDTPADSDIRRRIAATYAQIGALDAVSVRVQDGVVLLTGEVSNEADANRALELAGKFDGVIAVDDGIERSLDIEGNVGPLINKLRSSVAGWMQAAPLLLLAFLIFATVGFIGHQLAGWSSLWRRLSPNPFLGELLAQAVRITFIVIGLILALNLIGATALIGTILGGAGMLGLAIGFAVRDTLENYISSIMLSVRQPFRANDHVVIEGKEGRVVRLTSRATVLMTLDGNHLRIPNSMVFKAVILNYTRNPERRFDFELGIDADDDPVQAMSVGLEAMGNLRFVLAQPEPNAIIKSVGDSNIVVQFMAWVDQSASDFGKSRSLAIRAVKTVLEEQGFTLPEPIYRLRFDSDVIEKQLTATVSRPGAEPQKSAKTTVPKVVTGNTQDILDVTPDKHLESKVSDERASDADSGDDLLDASRPVE